MTTIDKNLCRRPKWRRKRRPVGFTNLTIRLLTINSYLEEGMERKITSSLKKYTTETPRLTL
jgi:hypothetical protein